MKTILSVAISVFLILEASGQGLSITKVFTIEEDGFNATSIAEIEVSDEYLPFSIIINKTTPKLAKAMVLKGEYEYLAGRLADTLRFYSKTISVTDFTTFSEKNITIKSDSTEFKLSNTNRVGGGTSGLRFRKKIDKISYMFVLPTNFKVTKIETTPSNVEKTIQSMIAIIVAEKTDRFEYEITYKKFNKSGFIKGNRKEEIIKTFHLEKKRYNLDLWDSKLSDGDKINIYINGSLVMPDLEITNDVFTFPIPLEKAKKDHSFILIESQSEGSVGPNTIQGKLYGNGINSEFRIFTNQKTNAVIELFVK